MLNPIRAPRTSDGLAPPLHQVDPVHVELHGRKLIYLAGCDYLRLSFHRDILQAIHATLDSSGLNVAASRRTTGNHVLYESLERTARRFFQAESATLVSSGYATNLCVAQALAGTITRVLIDERAHGSLQDAAHLTGAPITRFRHRDPADALRAVRRAGRHARLLLMTDGLMAHSGEVAPLDEYLALLPRTARMLVDDAHGAGVIGRHGRGTIEYQRLPRDRVIQTVTLSKAFGVYGGLILGSRELRTAILSRSRIFIGNTPLPLPLAAGAQRALELARACPDRRQRLNFNTACLKDALRDTGVPVNQGPGPILPIHPRSHHDARRLSRALLRAGFHPPLIEYQGPAGAAYFRFAVSSEHEPAQLLALARVLQRSLAPVR